MLIDGFEMYAGKGSSATIWDELNLNRLLKPIVSVIKKGNTRSLLKDKSSEKDFFSFEEIHPLQYFVDSGIMQFVFRHPIEFMLLPDQLRSFRFRTHWKINLLMHGDN